MAIITLSSVPVHLDQSEVAALLTSPQGDVAKDLLRRGTLVESQAKLNATGKEYPSGLRGPNVRTGRLRASITHALGQDDKGLYVDIGTNVVYGRYLEEGTAAHTRPAHVRTLKSGKKVGVSDYLHPGFKRFPFLEPALEAGLQ